MEKKHGYCAKNLKSRLKTQGWEKPPKTIRLKVAKFSSVLEKQERQNLLNESQEINQID